MIYFLLKTISMVITDKPSNTETFLNKEQYNYYLNKVYGKITDKKEEYLIQEFNIISKANQELQKVYIDFNDNKITEEELYATLEENSNILKYEKGFQLVFEQYTYARENTENRFLMDTNGWAGLLANDKIDLFYIFLIIILTVPVICTEYESRMNEINITVRKGNKYIITTKFIVSFTIIILLSILNSIIDYMFYNIKYGLNHSDYPLQSLEFYSNSSSNLSLFSTYLLIILLQIMGYLCFGLSILFLSDMLKKYTLVSFFSAMIVILPYYVFNRSYVKYYLPGPIGFIIAKGYFRGNEFSGATMNTDKEVIFKEISRKYFLFLIILTVITYIVIGIFIWFRNENKRCKKKKYIKVWRVSIFFFCTSLIINITGCSCLNSNTTSINYNYTTRNVAENSNYIFFINQDNSDKKIVFEDLSTDIDENLVRDPFHALTYVADHFFCNGNYIYYIKYSQDKSYFYSSMDKMEIVQVNLKTFSEKVIYESNINEYSESFIGLVAKNNKGSLKLEHISGFFIDNKFIYLIFEDEIERVNRITGKTEVIINYPTIRNVAFDGEFIYYINEKMHLVRYDTKSKNEKEYINVVTEKYILINNNIFFINIKDHNRIYVINLIDDNVKKLTDKSAILLKGDNDSIFFVNVKGFLLYRIDSNGENERKVLDDPVENIDVFQNSNKIFIRLLKDSDNNIIMNKETLDH